MPKIINKLLFNSKKRDKIIIHMIHFEKIYILNLLISKNMHKRDKINLFDQSSR
jgi:hypothetical protein